MPTMRALLAFLLLYGGSGLSTRAGSDAMSPVLEVGAEPRMFVDRSLVESLHGATLCLQRSTPREVVFRFDAPWEGAECGYVTVLQDGPIYRMYYRGGGETTQEVTCMAESRDGVRWTRPTLGLFDFNGSKSNNIVFRGSTRAYSESHNFTPFVDVNPAAKPAERYKALALMKHQDRSGQKRRALAGLASPDGVHWHKLQDEPIIIGSGFDSQNLAFWDTRQQVYACYFREGRDGLRSVRRCLSPDFVHWSAPEWLDFGNTPPEQFYTSAIAPYFRNPNLYLGFPMRFVPERKEVGPEGRKVDALSDGVMVSSYDGLHFSREFMEAFIRPGLDPKNWGNGHGNNTPSWGLLPTGEGEMSLYWAEHYGADYSGKAGKIEPGLAPQLRRGSLRLDGLGSVHAGYGGGELITKAFLFKGRRLRLNYSTSAVGMVRVEMQDADGTPLPGLGANDCREIYGDELDRAVTWSEVASLDRLTGRTVKLKVLLKDADLYSLRVEP